MRVAAWSCSLLIALSMVSGCTELVSPDTTRLGGVDAGPIDASQSDGGLPPRDGGAEDDTGVPGEDAAGTDASGPDTGCAFDARCEGGVLTRCEGGMTVTDTCDLGCATDGPARCGELDPSNVDASLFDPGAPAVRIDAMLVFDTGPCASSMATSMIGHQDDGSEVCLLIVSDLEITGSGSLRVIGGRPLIVLASGDVDIDGVLDASATLTTPGPGGAGGGTPTAHDGYGAAFGHGGAFESYDDGGGGGGAFGGGGGHGGQGGGAPGGEGGGARPSDELIPLVGGSGGGLGNGTETTGVRGNSGLGGAGGGALQISALGTIRVTGSILAAGGGGSGGRNGAGNWGAGGGGGSGGGILLEAVTLEIRGRLWTTGGGGGGGASSSARGGDGQDGRGAAGTAMGGMSGGTMYGAAGGDSGALGASDGEDGDDNLGGAGNGGGGGGGVGCIVLRDLTGTGGIDPSARLSPSTASIHSLRLR